ncbi:MAG TPA: hypothetical protein VMR98_00050 [Candidatus Polarisedimenticolaceae bacterium]|nr:hypothetical protein [Candidatus Polarisedimenticolaceae bacterium]
MKKTAKKNKTVIIGLLIIALLALGGAAYVKFGQKPEAVSSTTPPPAGPSHDTPPPEPSPGTPPPAPNPSHPPASTLAKPIGPGNNTSNVSLSGATGMESVCRSVPGASCYIQASKDGQVLKVSEAKVIGSTSGSDGVILNWDAKQLSAGQWQIQAIAAKDGQTAASDAQALMVRP